MTHLDLGQSYILNGEISYGESKPWTDFNLLYPLPSCVSIMNCQHNSPSPPLQRKYRGRFGEKCLYGNNLAYYQWVLLLGIHLASLQDSIYLFNLYLGEIE